MKTDIEDIKKLNELVSTLEKFKTDIEATDYTHHRTSFFQIMQDFRKFIASVKDQNLCDMLLHSQYFNKYQKFFSDINMYYIRSLESLQSCSIMTSGKHGLNNFIDLIDAQVIKECYEMKGEEIKSLDLSNAHNLVCIGSGPMPETLLYFYENTDIENIIGLDYNHEAIFMASEMVNGLGLDKISLVQIDGLEYDYKDADIVYIPLFISNKSEMINRIVETSKKDVQILVNAGKGLGKLIYDDLRTINPRLKVEYKDDAYCSYKAQEIIKLVKYDF